MSTGRSNRSVKYKWLECQYQYQNQTFKLIVQVSSNSSEVRRIKKSDNVSMIVSTRSKNYWTIRVAPPSGSCTSISSVHCRIFEQVVRCVKERKW